MDPTLKKLEDELLADITKLNTKLCENSLAEFTKQAWFIIEPETKLEWNWHLDTLCAYLEATMNPAIHITRLIINVPPGSLKSILVSVMFPAWMWIKYPSKRILGVANAQDLSIRDSRRTKQIITDPWYTDQWPLMLKSDQSAKTNYENDSGGFRVSLGITANITGKRGDCFTADTLVDTEFGPKLITNVNVGDKVWSFNTATNTKELQPVEGLYSSEVSSLRPINRLHLNTKSDGTGISSFIDCTPDHKFYTNESGMVAAKDLVPRMVAAKDLGANKPISSSESPDSLFSTTKLSRQSGNRIQRIHNFFRFFGTKNTAPAISIRRSKIFGYIFPRSTSSNFMYSSKSNSVFTNAFRGGTFTGINVDNIIGGKNMFTSSKSTMLNSICHIVSSSTVLEIVSKIISDVSIKMSNFASTMRFWSFECSNYALMSVKHFSNPVYVRAYSQVPFGIRPKFSNFSFLKIIGGAFYNAIKCPDSSKVTNFVHTLKSGNGSPLFVTGISAHAESPVHCIQVKGNHNMYAMSSQDSMKHDILCLVSNCIIIDDPHDSVTAQSQLQRETVLTAYDTKLSTRVNSQQHSVIILIMQRLHHLDLTGHLLQKTKTKWTHLVMPMHYDVNYTYNAGRDLGLPQYNDPRKADELLFPTIFPKEVVEKLEEDLGTYGCTPAETPILMEDLSYQNIADIRVGDSVTGFTKNVSVKGGPSKVTEVFSYANADVYEYTLENGDIIRCTEDHKWFTQERGPNRKKYLPITLNKSKLAKVTNPIPILNATEERLARWLAGFFDADGSACLNKRKDKYRASVQIKFYQGSGRNLPMCEKLEYALTYFGFKFTYAFDERKDNKTAACFGYRTYTLSKNKGETTLGLMQRFLHIVQPVKWRDRIIDGSKMIKFIEGRYQVVQRKFISKQTVYALTTETGNYIAWGYASSNSAGQMEQQPSVKGGGILREDWFRVLPDDVDLPICEHVFISCDTAYSEKDMINNSFSAFTTWGVFWNKAQQRDCVLLLDVWFDRVDYPELRARAKEMDKDKKPDVWLIEKKASGQCYDDKTEILTDSGWKLFSDIDTTQDSFATRNMDSKEFEWQKATAELHEEYSGDMYMFKGKTHDALVTPEHRMLVNTLPLSLGGHSPSRTKGQDCIVTAKQLAEHGGEKTKTPMFSVWNGTRISSKFLFDPEFKPGLAGYKAKVLNVSGDTYIKFMAMYLSEGWTQHNSKSRYYGVHIGQYESSPDYANFYSVMADINQGKIPKTRRGKEMYLTNKHLYGFVRQFGLYCDTKFIPEDIMNSTPEQLQLFWDWYMKGDGHITKPKMSTSSKPESRNSKLSQGHQAITTTSKRMAGQLQELAQKMGYSASVRLSSVPKKPFRIDKNKKLTDPKNLKPCYVVRLRTSKSQKLNPTKVKYEGKIHCVQVPNGIVYVRRNGFPMWCGNSLIQDLRQSGLMVRTYSPDKDKISRAYAVQPMLESGQVWIPNRKWARAFTYLMSTFPTGVAESNDLADTLTQALLYIKNGYYVTHPDDEDFDVPDVKRYSAYGNHITDDLDIDTRMH